MPRVNLIPSFHALSVDMDTQFIEHVRLIEDLEQFIYSLVLNTYSYDYDTGYLARE